MVDCGKIESLSLKARSSGFYVCAMWRLESLSEIKGIRVLS